MSGVTITRPQGMNLMDWASQIVLDLDAYGSFGRLEDPALWQDWAMQYFNNSALGRNFPVPYDFQDWREWAERFAQLLS